ncbi:MAG: hypothetical protein JXN10_10350 [Clostridia bacterium]|nr:hypothetical protein [Clostridia bacterium]
MMLDQMKLNQYADKFETNFPIFCVRDMDDKEITKLIQDALDTETPFKVTNKKDIDY